MFKRYILPLLVGLASFFILPAYGRAQTVLQHARIGGYSEDITFATSGPLKDNIVIADGYEVYAVPVASKEKGKNPMVRLFDLKGLGIDVNPRGITYIESEGLFAVNDIGQRPTLFLFDSQGQARGTRTIQYLNGYLPGHLEGMSYIPPTSPVFPDHLLLVALDTLNGPSRIEVMKRDGQVVKEIFPNWPAGPDTSFMGDVAFLAPNRLLVTFYDNSIWTIDFNGNVVAGPQIVPGADGFEGIVQMSDGRIVAVGYPQKLLFFDKNLVRQPENDRNDIIGLNLNNPSGVAWNSDTNQLLIAHSVAFPSSAGIAAVPTSLETASPVVNLSSFPLSRRMTYLPNEHLIAIVHGNNPRAILLFKNDGTLDSQVDLSPASLGQNFGAPSTITYIPVANQFVVGFNGINGSPDQPAERRRLRVFSRTGTLVRTIDLACTGTGGIGALAYFDDPGGGGGRFIILGSAGRILITDLDGHLLREFNSRVKLGLLSRTDIATITTGPLAGAFCIVDSSGGEIVIFRLN